MMQLVMVRVFSMGWSCPNNEIHQKNVLLEIIGFVKIKNAVYGKVDSFSYCYGCYGSYFSNFDYPNYSDSASLDMAEAFCRIS